MEKAIRFVLMGVMIALLSAVGVASQQEIVFTYATSQETMTFDPAIALDETELANVMNTYEPLVYPVKGKAPKPWLAERWEASEDGLVYTFYLRKGVKFHDGTELTAEDVAFSMDRMLRLKKGYSWLWVGVLDPGDTKVIDKYTVAFHLNEPFGPFIATLVLFFIMNEDLIMANIKPGEFGKFGDYGQEFLATADAGSGPYMVESVELGDRITFRKFEDYWRGWEENQIDKIRWLVIPERATQVAMLKKGDADMVDQWLSPETYKDLAATPGVVVQEDPNPQLYFFHMHNKKPPLDCIYVRKAISYAYDYETTIKDIFKGGVQAQGPVPILMPGHNPDVVVYRRDIEKAKEYLQKSKYSLEELKKMKLTYVWVTGVELERMTGLLLKSNLKEIGLEVEIRGEMWSRIVDMVTKPETTPHFVAIYHTAKYPSPDSHTYLMFHPRAWGTYMSASWYENPKVTELLDKARRTVDMEERYKLYGEVQRIVTEDAALLFIINPMHRIAFRDHVKGYEFMGILGYDLVFYNLRMER
jgi:peptide/nickel transport system substrate-binding protein